MGFLWRVLEAKLVAAAVAEKSDCLNAVCMNPNS